MRFKFVIYAEVQRTEGKFASRDEIEEQLLDWLDSANNGSVEGAEGGQYEVADWSVEPEEIKRSK